MADLTTPQSKIYARLREGRNDDPHKRGVVISGRRLRVARNLEQLGLARRLGPCGRSQDLYVWLCSWCHQEHGGTTDPRRHALCGP